MTTSPAVRDLNDAIRWTTPSLTERMSAEAVAVRAREYTDTIGRGAAPSLMVVDFTERDLRAEVLIGRIERLRRNRAR